MENSRGWAEAKATPTLSSAISYDYSIISMCQKLRGAHVLRIGRVMDWIIILASVIACGVLAAMMLMTTADVSMRYLLNNPIGRVVELNILLLPVFIFLALAETQRLRGHINVNLLTSHFSPRVQIALEILVFALGFAFLLVMGLQAFKAGMHAYVTKQTLFGSFPQLPTWWSKSAIALGCWLLCLQYIKDIANNIMRLFQHSQKLN